VKKEGMLQAVMGLYEQQGFLFPNITLEAESALTLVF
jgi:hypothetical protein